VNNDARSSRNTIKATVAVMLLITACAILGPGTYYVVEKEIYLAGMREEAHQDFEEAYKGGEGTA
jgi:hypothetical protein